MLYLKAKINDLHVLVLKPHPRWFPFFYLETRNLCLGDEDHFVCFKIWVFWWMYGIKRLKESIITGQSALRFHLHKSQRLCTCEPSISLQYTSHSFYPGFLLHDCQLSVSSLISDESYINAVSLTEGCLK